MTNVIGSQLKRADLRENIFDMKILIVYMSHHGTTRKAATILKDTLSDESVTVVDLQRDKVQDLDSFDTILIGGSIHAGRIQTRIRNFCRKNLDVLLSKKIGLFLCYMDEERAIEQFENAFPQVLRTHALAEGLFGGEMLFEKMNFLEKWMVRKVSGITASVSKLNYGEIDDFASCFGHQVRQAYPESTAQVVSDPNTGHAANIVQLEFFKHR